MTMEKPTPVWTQWLGGVLLLFLMALIVSSMFLRESESGHTMFIFLRWPFWAIMGLGIPLISIRLLLWRKPRPGTPPSAEDGQ